MKVNVFVPHCQKGDNTSYCYFFSLSNLQILKKTHRPIIDVMIFLYLASVPCVTPVIVIQKHEQSMYCFMVYSLGVIY